MSDSPIESTKGLHESKERKPENLTPRDWTVIRLAVDIARIGLEGNPCPDLSTEENASVRADYEAIAEKLKLHPLSPSGDDEELKEAIDRLLDSGPTIDGVPLIEWMSDPESKAARKAIESLFGRIREELKEALAEVDRLHALSLRLRT